MTPAAQMRGHLAEWRRRGLQNFNAAWQLSLWRIEFPDHRIGPRHEWVAALEFAKSEYRLAYFRETSTIGPTFAALAEELAA